MGELNKRKMPFVSFGLRMLFQPFLSIQSSLACHTVTSAFRRLMNQMAISTMCFSFSTSTKSSLSNHIPDVVRLSSKKQMRWINAWRIIAFVKYGHIFWNWPTKQSPRSAMSHFFSIFDRPPCETSIASRCSSALIFPAFRRRFIGNEICESFFFIFHC